MKTFKFYSPDDVAPSSPSKEEEKDKAEELHEELEEVEQEVEETVNEYGNELLERLDNINGRLEELERRYADIGGARAADEPSSPAESPAEAPAEETAQEPETAPAPGHFWFRRWKH